ncbi:hypothetical protein SEVIR_1G115250v4 [Setaria viridis]
MPRPTFFFHLSYFNTSKSLLGGISLWLRQPARGGYGGWIRRFMGESFDELTVIMVALLVPHPFLEVLLFGPQLLKFLWLKNFASVVSLDVIPSLEASHRRPRPIWLLLWLAKLALEV